MEARRSRTIAPGVLLMLVWGCVMPPRSAQPPAPIPPAEPPPRAEIVEAGPETATPEETRAAEVDGLVQSFIQRHDDIASRAQRSPPLPLSTPPPPPVDDVAWHAAYAEPPLDAAAAGSQDQSPAGQVREAAPPASQPALGAPLPTPPESVVTPQPPHQSDDTPAVETIAVPTSPPRLIAVSAGPETGRPAGTLPPAETGAPQINRPTRASGAPLSLQSFLEQWSGDADDANFRQQLDLRIMRVIAGDDLGARQPLPMASTEQQELAARLIESLIAVREDAHGGDPPRVANRVLEEWQRLEDVLRPLSELRLPVIAVCSEVAGFGQYEPIIPPRFRAGVANEFVLYCEVRNFVRRKQDDGFYETRFDLRTRVLNQAGEAVLDLRDNDVIDRCRQPRQDCFVPRLVRLPSTFAPGEYVVKVTVIDKLGEKLAENRATIQVVAGP